MDKLIDMLKEAFDAGMACSAAYEWGTYSVDFKKWREENKEEIEQLHRTLLATKPETKD
jgi:hypothetical protein